MIIIYYHKISTMNWSLCGHKIWSAKYLEHYKRYYYKLRALKFFIQVWFFIAKINRLNPIVGASCLILLLFINVTFTGHANIHSNIFWAFLPLPPPPPPPRTMDVFLSNFCCQQLHTVANLHHLIISLLGRQNLLSITKVVGHPN